MATTSEAPGKLELVRAFINTVEKDGSLTADDLTSPHSHVIREDLRSPVDLAAWLAERGLVELNAQPTPADLGRAKRFREALRAMLVANAEAIVPDQVAVAELNDVGMRARFALCVGNDGHVSLESVAHGIDGALGRLLAIVQEAVVNGTWPRLKACRNDTCRWAFYDQSKNRSATWCDMAVCGSRVKARNYRRRQRATASS